MWQPELEESESVGIPEAFAQFLGCVASALQDALALGPDPIQLRARIAWLMETLIKGLNFPEAPG